MICTLSGCQIVSHQPNTVRLQLSSSETTHCSGLEELGSNFLLFLRKMNITFYLFLFLEVIFVDYCFRIRCALCNCLNDDRLGQGQLICFGILASSVHHPDSPNPSGINGTSGNRMLVTGGLEKLHNTEGDEQEDEESQMAVDEDSRDSTSCDR